ncbi:metallophosphoesterase family protein [Paenibacillus sp. TAB 01]|uniref:metallophosphoesterase family protein n=1 Tax=Paenibacillus sp. TAB 01 TaxID=3368988 RepID=UPI0037515961
MLVFLDTAKEMDFKDWGGWIDEEQLRWFEQVIQDSGTKPVLVFAHHPVHKTTTHSDRDKGSIHPDIDMWSILSQKQGIGIYFNGHTHIDSIVQQNNWTFVQLSACLDEHGLRIVDIGEEDIRITAIDIAEAALTDNAGTLYTHMKHFKPTADACGNDAERECTVSLRLATEQK